MYKACTTIHTHISRHLHLGIYVFHHQSIHLLNSYIFVHHKTNALTNPYPIPLLTNSRPYSPGPYTPINDPTLQVNFTLHA